MKDTGIRLECWVCGKPGDPETMHWPHEEHCSGDDDRCDCDAVTCPECCWECTSP